MPTGEHTIGIVNSRRNLNIRPSSAMANILGPIGKGISVLTRTAIATIPTHPNEGLACGRYNFPYANKCYLALTYYAL